MSFITATHVIINAQMAICSIKILPFIYDNASNPDSPKIVSAAKAFGFNVDFFDSLFLMFLMEALVSNLDMFSDY
ncbi:hypothetical protein [Winogradskyella alexanderae]|uniref:Uncharacterized protein n=1 Tax=Winogradskyella alexanderae TaxID=2877123 RepID=A0ABS7XTU8_9FLAO|nr:hypothetical protein [Winogradskyella alexanderae]MCA0133452.1 hypothetical protein [Winogradskyella alexanderae]